MNKCKNSFSIVKKDCKEDCCGQEFRDNFKALTSQLTGIFTSPPLAAANLAIASLALLNIQLAIDQMNPFGVGFELEQLLAEVNSAVINLGDLAATLFNARLTLRLIKYDVINCPCINISDTERAAIISLIDKAIQSNNAVSAIRDSIIFNLAALRPLIIAAIAAASTFDIPTIILALAPVKELFTTIAGQSVQLNTALTTAFEDASAVLAALLDSSLLNGCKETTQFIRC